MATDWDSSGNDTDADTVKLDETRVRSDSRDAYDIDPDTENYADGNDPETAYQNQGRPDSPNGLSAYTSDDHSQEYGEARGDEAEPADENTDKAGDSPDRWDDADPDAANYADLDDPGTGTLDAQDGLRQDEPGTANGQAADADEHAERALSPEQQQINALEAENTDARQQLTEAKEQIADSNQRIAELEAEKDQQAAKLDEQATRLDRIEQLLAGSEKSPDDPGAHEQRGDHPIASAEQQKAQDTAIDKRETSDERKDAKEAERSRWRRFASSDSFEAASVIVGAAGSVSDFATHVTPLGTAGVAATALGLGALGLKRLEQRRKDKG